MKGQNSHVGSINRLSAEPLQKLEDLILGQKLSVRKDHFIHSPRVGDYMRHISPNVPDVCQGSGHISVSSNGVSRHNEGVVDTSRWKTWKRQLEPPPNINNGVGEVEFLDMIQNIFFLLGELAR